MLQHAGVVSDLDGVYRLTGGAVASVSLNTLAITMTRGDLNGIKAREAMCTSSSDTFLSVDAGSVFDMGSQPLRALSGQQMAAFTPDSVAPILESFSLDLSAEVLPHLWRSCAREHTEG